jgi:hypothetical protein
LDPAELTIRFSTEERKADSSLESSTVIMPDPSGSMTLSSLRLPTPKASRTNMATATSHFGSEDNGYDNDDAGSVHSDSSSFFDVEGVATATTTTGSVRHDEDDFDFVSEEEEDETGDEL